MGLALVLHLERARPVRKSVSKLVYICSCITSGKHILPSTLCPPFGCELRTKNLPTKEVHSKSSHIQNVTIVNLCLVNQTFKTPTTTTSYNQNSESGQKQSPLASRQNVKTIPPNAHHPASPPNRHLLPRRHAHPAHLRVRIVDHQNPLHGLWRKYQPGECHGREPIPRSASLGKVALARLSPCLRRERGWSVCERGV